jgi:RNA polymerase sigma factor (sigma-70 family)
MEISALASKSGDGGHAFAIQETVLRQRNRLLEFIRRRIGNDEDAEDLLQEVFAQLVTSINVTEPIENLTAWLFTVARNKIIDWYRKRRLPLATGTGREDEGPSGIEDLVVDPEDGPDREFWRSMVWKELAEALEDLPEEQRQVFVWHELEGRSYREIGRMTGAPLSTLLSRKRYAVLRLRERLQDLYDDLDTSY